MGVGASSRASKEGLGSAREAILREQSQAGGGRAVRAQGAGGTETPRPRFPGTCGSAGPCRPSQAPRHQAQTFLDQECHEILHCVRPSSEARVYKEFSGKGERMTKSASLALCSVSLRGNNPATGRRGDFL